VWSDNELLQLPHFTNEIAATCGSKKWHVSSISAFKRMAPEKREELLRGEGLNDSQIQDIEKVTAYLPTNVDCTFDYGIEGEETSKIICGSVVTLQFIIARGVLELELAGEESKEKKEKKEIKKEENGQTRMVHAPLFPEPREECWWIVIDNPNTFDLVGIHKVGNFEKSTECKIKFLAPAVPGNYSYAVHLICDGYLGCDREKLLRISAVKSDVAMNNREERAVGKNAKNNKKQVVKKVKEEEKKEELTDSEEDSDTNDDDTDSDGIISDGE